MKKVLIVIDMQIGFINDNTLRVARHIGNLLEKGEYDAVIATKFTNVKGSSYDKLLNWQGMLESRDKELLPIVENYADCIISKCSYSCVNANFIQSMVALCDGLPEDVSIVGVDTDACVLATAIDLFELGIRPVIIEDCVGSSGGDEYHDAGMLLLKRSIGEKQIV